MIDSVTEDRKIVHVQMSDSNLNERLNDHDRIFLSFIEMFGYETADLTIGHEIR